MKNYLLCTITACTVLELNLTHIQLQCQSQHNITLSYACSHTYFTAIYIFMTYSQLASWLAKLQMQSRQCVSTSHRLVHSFQNYIMMLLNMSQWSVYHRQLVTEIFTSFLITFQMASNRTQQHRKYFLITIEQCVRTIFQGVASYLDHFQQYCFVKEL